MKYKEGEEVQRPKYKKDSIHGHNKSRDSARRNTAAEKCKEPLI